MSNLFSMVNKYCILLDSTISILLYWINRKKMILSLRKCENVNYNIYSTISIAVNKFTVERSRFHGGKYEMEIAQSGKGIPIKYSIGRFIRRGGYKSLLPFRINVCGVKELWFVTLKCLVLFFFLILLWVVKWFIISSNSSKSYFHTYLINFKS